MFFRVLILAIAGVVVYRVLKSLLGGTGTGRFDPTHQPQDRVDDLMVQDPVCGTHFPKRDAVTLNRSNDVLYFCSDKCRDRYAAQQSERS